MASSTLAASQAAAAVAPIDSVVPVPVSVQAVPNVTYNLTSSTQIRAAEAATGVADLLAATLRRSTGFALPVSQSTGDGISLQLSGADPRVGQQGYQIDVTATGVVIKANTAAGLFAGTQTLRQLLPAKVEASSVQSGPWPVPGARIADHPRFAYRGAMLDVARHFFTPDLVKRYIDEVALYKINHLHLHLSDDQGWRIMIDSWPRLATYGGSTQVGGGPGGYYTKAQYSDIVAYAAARHITVVPEIDMPGHTNAALASYAELNCNNTAPPPYTGTNVGFSSLCVPKDVTYRFVDDVIRELAALTPGPYIHIGGDEARSTSDADYRAFIDKVLPIVAKYGKQPIGWHEMAKANPPATSTPQFWGTTTSNAPVTAAANRGSKVLMSPANKAYLDMKYNSSTPLGLTWAGYIEVRTAYDWNPGAYLSGVGEAAVRGVEAPLWTETVKTRQDIEYMAFPRLPAIAELGWSPWSKHSWDAFRQRLGAQGPRWQVMGVNYYRSTQVPWV
ncbi:hexosaminidase [Kibdelosporangium phytohabitans]|uniref:beta-N-acetylhexosaminidase n=1 Tax=Kibdelosporangium phytohabitans TaxID=860235 RepID=A0A0N7F543_9PSEU|nr:beta-N-acetylhexosaminidase [Kibdelosporangium phytohabitans]ALG13191.1 beta-N-acetylhexosaminidase [Kibdelosporangium phytohabitans]MBE1464954.1 hexosaminidase [Kibdelosporangium phytohabitans]